MKEFIKAIFALLVALLVIALRYLILYAPTIIRTIVERLASWWHFSR